ncbi:MAG: hypothetical protein KJZ64_00790 [Sphingomonadaceae bacterium]|nr:hypothetical protein [Sphingomonadaceae bacterium]
MKPRSTALALGLALAMPCLLAVSSPVAADEAALAMDEATVDRLVNNRGVTLQWIGWDQRGQAHARQGGDGLYLTASQVDPLKPGAVFLDGKVTQAGPDWFTFEGVIRITHSPDEGRVCERNKTWHFAITQNRKYYRLREFEWCDGLTDYIDIYF